MAQLSPPFQALPPSPPPVTVVSPPSSHRKSSSHLLLDLENEPSPEEGDTVCDTANGSHRSQSLPSTHYYVGPDGRLRARRCWRLYTKARRLVGFLVPWFKHDSNTFLCAPLVENTVLNVTLLLVRLLAVHALLTPVLSIGDGGPAHEESAARLCKDYTRNLLDISSYTVSFIFILCLPAINRSKCRLHRRRGGSERSKSRRTILTHSSSSAANAALAVGVDLANEREDTCERVEKTPLFRICELIVVLEVLYLMCTFIMLFTSDSKENIFHLVDACYTNQNLGAGAIIVVVLVQLLAVLAYGLRWRQLVLFHHLHLHLLYQRGVLPGRARFDYVEKSYVFIPSLLGGHKGARHSRKVYELKAALYRAAKNGDVAQVRASVAEAIELDGADFAGKWYPPHPHPRCPLLFASCRRNPLHVAVVFDQPEVVRELLTGPAQFDPNALDKLEVLKLGLSWLYRVLFRVVAVLNRAEFAAARATNEETQPFGVAGIGHCTLLSPLHAAATMGNADMVLLLLRHGADANLTARSTDARFTTPPLFWARTKDCARLLLDADADPLFIPNNNFCLTAFEVARLAGNRPVARLMEKFGGDVALTPLHAVSARGLTEEVHFFLKHGATVDTLGEQVAGFFRRTPLHWAAMRGQVETMRLLIRYGANVDACDVFGRSPLAWACVLGRAAAVELLLEHGADPNVRDAQGDPLLCVCAAGVSRTTLVTGSSKPSSHDHDDDHEPIDHRHARARSLDPRVFALLVQHGVDLRATRASNGDTALHVALRHGNETAALLLVRAGLSLTTPNLLGQRAIECTTSTTLRYAVKKEAGQRDVMISYTHSHAPLARRIRDALEAAHVTTWIDAMDPTGIPGGAEWRREIASGIQSSALVLAVLTHDYPSSPWCMKELAFARLHNVPVVAVQCDDMVIPEELQVYLWTRQIVDFRPAVAPQPAIDAGSRSRAGSHAEPIATTEESDRDVDKEFDDSRREVFQDCVRLLLDGIHDQIEERRARLAARQEQPVATEDTLNAEDEQRCLAADAAHDKANAQGRTPLDFGDATSSLATMLLPETASSSALGSESTPFVFIAHGDFHAPFCRRLRASLARHGVRAVIDEAAPAVAYTSDIGEVDQPATAPSSSRGMLVRAPSGANESTLSVLGAQSAQARQLAAKDAILACSAVIVVLSPVSTGCGQLQDQLAFAEDRGKLVVPLLLSLHSVSLAQRYSFSRSLVHHFNASLGFPESAERLATYLRAHAKHDRQRQLRRPSATDLVIQELDRNSQLISSPASWSSVSDVVEVRSPSSPLNGNPIDEISPPPERSPVRQHLRRHASGTGGHGWRLRSATEIEQQPREGSVSRTPPARMRSLESLVGNRNDRRARNATTWGTGHERFSPP